MLCLYPHSSNVSGTPCDPTFHNIKESAVFLYLIKNDIMMACGGLETYIHALLNFLLV
jgi:hypothetical protein